MESVGFAFGGTATLGCAVFAFATRAPLAVIPACAKLGILMCFYRRNLPPWQPDGKSIFLTRRLFGSLPTSVAKTLSDDLSEPWGRRFGALDKRLDSAIIGPRWLAEAPIANYVHEAIICGAALRHYDLCAYVIMPNHVHVLLQPFVPLA